MSDDAEVDATPTTGITPVTHDVASMATPLAMAVAVLALPAMVIGAMLCWATTVAPWWLGALLGLIIAAAYVWRRFDRAHDIVVGALTGGESVSVVSPRLENLLDGMSLVGGVARPEILVVDEEALNALAIRRKGDLTIAVTRGLLERTDLIELEGVVAELVARLRSGDAEAGTVASALFQLAPGPLASLLGLVSGPARATLFDGDRDLVADRQAVSLTRYPPGLRRALAIIADDEATMSWVAPALDELWLVDPTRGPRTGSTAESDERRAPLELRLDILSEL